MYFIRLFLFLVCFAIFIYQFVDVTKSYLQYETATRIRYDNQDTTMPAFYFCLKHPFTAQQMFDYLKLESHRTSKGELDYDYYKRKFGNITNTQFYVYLMNKFLKRVEQGKLKEMLLYPIDDEIQYGVYFFDILFSNGTSFSVDGARKAFKSERNLTTIDIFKTDYLIDLHSLSKCVAFFNFEPKETGFSFQQTLPLTTYVMQFFQQELMFELNVLKGQYALSIMGAREIPSEGELTIIETESDYKVGIQMTMVERLEAPYDTNCKNYEQLGKKNLIKNSILHSELNSQSKCLAKCTLDFKNPEMAISSTILYPESFYLTSSRWIRFGQKIRHQYSADSNVSIGLVKDSEKWCRKQCPADCKQMEYSLVLSHTKINQRNLTHLYFKTPNYFTRISHHPEITFLSYLGIIGGLTGVWLGISCYHISSLAAMKCSKTISFLFFKYRYLSKKRQKRVRHKTRIAFLD